MPRVRCQLQFPVCTLTLESYSLSTLEGEWHELEAKRAKKKRKFEVESETVAAISSQN